MARHYIFSRFICRTPWFVLTSVLILTGCVTEVPKFSHIHIGHSMTGWVNTPGNRGLFVEAEKIADNIARLSVESINAVSKSDQSIVVQNSQQILLLLGDDPHPEIKEQGKYTFLAAFQGSVDHMGFAAESEDASENIKQGVRKFIANSGTIFARVEVLWTLAEAATSESDANVLADIAREIRVLAVQNLEGEDIDNNNYIGDTPEEYGLRQLRRDVASMLEKEDPAYRPVEQRYLFGLVRLPDGTWSFRDPGSGGGSYGKYSY